MMRSKATAALMKLKEMDKKYKIKCSLIDEEKSNSSLSDISAIIDQVPKHDILGSGDQPDPIANRRLKLDIRMPEAHMERDNQPGASETESPVKLVTISDEPSPKEAETPSRSASSVRQQVEEANEEDVQSPSALSSIKEEAEELETSISEDVLEVASRHLVADENQSQETTWKSVVSVMIDAEEVAASSIAAETYSDDFSRSSSPRKAESVSHEVRRDQNSSGSKDSEIVELVESPKTISSNFENPGQTTLTSSSARRRRRRSRGSPSSSSSKKDPEAFSQNSEKLKSCTESTRPEYEDEEDHGQRQLETVSLHDAENTEENSKSRILKDEKAESMNRVRVETLLPKQTLPRVKNRRLGKQKVRDCALKSKNRAKEAGNPKTRTRVEGPADEDRLKQQMREHHFRSRVRSHVQQFMNEQEQRLWARCFKDGLYGCHGFDGATGSRRSRDDRQQHHSFFKPLDLPNVAAFERPGKLVPADWNSEEDETPILDNERRLHLRRLRERILGIRQWLKQQFVLYRDYSTLVSTINAKYIPVTLKETKKMIHDMQRFCVPTVKNRVLS